MRGEEGFPLTHIAETSGMVSSSFLLALGPITKSDVDKASVVVPSLAMMVVCTMSRTGVPVRGSMMWQ
jgi:hypothetical protein